MSKRKRVSRPTRQEISSLRKENKKLKRDLQRAQRENLRLRRQVATMTAAGGKTQVPPSAVPLKGKISSQEMLFLEISTSGERYAASTYGRYLFLSVKESSLGRLIRRVVIFFRRLRIFRWIVNILLILLTAVLASAVVVTAIPLLLLSSVSTLFAVIFNAGSANRRMASALRGKHIRVVIPPEHTALGENAFWERCTKEMATHPHTAMIVVSPHFLSTRGLGGRGMYFTSRKESPQHDIFLVRKGYYFILKRHVLVKIDPNMTIIF